MELDRVLVQFVFRLLLFEGAAVSETRVHFIKHEAVGFIDGGLHVRLHDWRLVVHTKGWYNL